MKKLLALLVTMLLVFSMVGCSSSSTDTSSSDDTSSDTTSSDDQTATSEDTSTDTSEATDTSSTGIDASSIKVGVIYVGDENEGYTEAHMEGVQEMKEALGLSDDQIIEKTNIAEDESCYDAAVDLADQGCNIIFATSFGHEDYLVQAATEYPDIQFAHATGVQAASLGMSNFHNYFTSIYQARYVSGVVAGMKIQEMIDNGEITEDQAQIGYVGAYPYAEVISGFTAFYLGARSIVPSATMEVQYTNSWADMTAESEVATQLIADGSVLISQHADTTGAPTACEEAGVPVVGYNVDMTSVAPDVALTSATNDWGSYYTYAVQSVIDGTEMPYDWCQGYAEGAVGITPLNDAVVAEGTADKVAEVEESITDGSFNVFDTSTFTVDGSSLEDLIANDDDYAGYADYVSDGYYHESEKVSAPSFDLIIDGVTQLTE